ncbi:hypothetical protein ACTFO6_20095, partial [Pelomicrobium sp. G1]
LKSQGIAVSRDTLHRLLAYLEDCFLVRTVWMEADSERQRMVNPRKIYPVDAGPSLCSIAACLPVKRHSCSLWMKRGP